MNRCFILLASCWAVASNGCTLEQNLGDRATDGGANGDSSRETDSSSREGGSGDHAREGGSDGGGHPKDAGHDSTAHPSDAGDAPVSSEGLCEDGGWCWVNPVPQGADLRGVWEASPNDVWAVGDGVILHWDGTAWSPSGPQPAPLLYAVTGTSTNDVWAVGAAGTILHFDGTSWTTVQWITDPGADPAAPDLKGAFALSPTDAWAVGKAGTVLRWQGTTWSYAMPLPDASGTAAFSGLWASSTNDVWIASSATVDHWDGATWTTSYSGGLGPAIALWGTSPTSVWAAGGSGVLHWDGSTWSSVGTQSSDALWGAGATHVWAVGYSQDGIGSLSMWDGTSWTPTELPQSSTFLGATGSGPSDVWAVGTGGSLAHWDGSQWSLPWSSAVVSLAALQPECRSATIAGPSDFWIVGGTSTASGNQSFVAHGSGGTWSTSSISDLESADDVWGAATDDVWVVGVPANGSTGLEHWDGTKWSTVPISGGPVGFWSISGDSPSDVWAAGGQIVHWDGTSAETSFTIVGTAENPDPASPEIWADSPTDVYVVAGGTSGFHWNGTGWSIVDMSAGLPSGAHLASIGGTGPNDVWAIAGGTPPGVTHFDGTSWSPVSLPSFDDEANEILGVTATAPGAVWLGMGAYSPSAQGDILFWNGTSWNWEWVGTASVGAQVRSKKGVGAVALLNDNGCGLMFHHE